MENFLVYAGVAAAVWGVVRMYASDVEAFAQQKVPMLFEQDHLVV